MISPLGRPSLPLQEPEPEHSRGLQREPKQGASGLVAAHQEAEKEGALCIQGQPDPQSESQDSQGYTGKSCLKKTNKQTRRGQIILRPDYHHAEPFPLKKSCGVVGNWEELS